MDENIKICTMCGRGFVPAHNNAKLCSDECRAKSAKLIAFKQNEKRKEENRRKLGVRTCKICGTEFVPKNPQMVMCSRDCHRRKRNADRRSPKREVKRVYVVKKKPDKNEKLVQKAVLALESGMSYGKAELQTYLEKQSIEMAIRRRQMQDEWERRKQNG